MRPTEWLRVPGRRWWLPLTALVVLLFMAVACGEEEEGTPTATGTPRPGTPSALPPSGGGGLGPLSDMPWLTTLAAGAILAWVLAAAGLFHGIRRRAR